MKNVLFVVLVLEITTAATYAQNYQGTAEFRISVAKPKTSENPLPDKNKDISNFNKEIAFYRGGRKRRKLLIDSSLECGQPLEMLVLV